MLFTVVPTHVKGQRRTKADMAAAEQFTGEMTITTLDKNSANRPVQVAYLKDTEDRHGRIVLHPLFDVKVVKLTPNGMHLAGYQIESVPTDGTEGHTLVGFEYAQGWWAKFLTVVGQF